MWTDLKILKNKMLESIFIEIVNPNKKRTSLHGSHNESNVKNFRKNNKQFWMDAW